MRPPMRGGGGFGGRRGGGGGRGFARGGGRFGGRGGGGGFRDEGPPEEVVEVSSFLHASEGDAVARLTNEKIPYFNAPIYLENKTQIGKVDEIFGPINEAYFSIKMMDGIIATSYSLGDKFYIDPAKLLPLQRFLPPAKRLPAGLETCKTDLLDKKHEPMVKQLMSSRFVIYRKFHTVEMRSFASQKSDGGQTQAAGRGGGRGGRGGPRGGGRGGGFRGRGAPRGGRGGSFRGGGRGRGRS